ncbi:MAG TPA: hypothetical protein VGK14_03810 [Novimethylophilus sp.]|jgi:hypothetical protein
MKGMQNASLGYAALQILSEILIYFYVNSGFSLNLRLACPSLGRFA